MTTLKPAFWPLGEGGQPVSEVRCEAESIGSLHSQRPTRRAFRRRAARRPVRLAAHDDGDGLASSRSSALGREKRAKMTRRCGLSERSGRKTATPPSRPERSSRPDYARSGRPEPTRRSRIAHHCSAGSVRSTSIACHELDQQELQAPNAKPRKTTLSTTRPTKLLANAALTSPSFAAACRRPNRPSPTRRMQRSRRRRGWRGKRRRQSGTDNDRNRRPERDRAAAAPDRARSAPGRDEHAARRGEAWRHGDKTRPCGRRHADVVDQPVGERHTGAKAKKRTTPSLAGALQDDLACSFISLTRFYVH